MKKLDTRPSKNNTMHEGVWMTTVSVRCHPHPLLSSDLREFPLRRQRPDDRPEDLAQDELDKLHHSSPCIFSPTKNSTPIITLVKSSKNKNADHGDRAFRSNL